MLGDPRFLTLFPSVFIASLVVMAVVQSALTRIGSRLGADDVRLDAFQAAYLAGGRRRVVDTAIAGLAMSHRLPVSRRGRLGPAEHVAGDGPVELAVCEAVRGTSSRSAVYWRVRSHDAVRAVEGHVWSRGLLLAGPRARLWWVARLLPVALAAAGLLSAVGGNRRGADLTIMLVLLAIPLFWMLFGRSSPHNRPTPLGRAVLHRLEQRYRVDDVAHETYLRQLRARGRAPEPWDPLTAVGVLGFVAVPSPDLRAALLSSLGAASGE
jgi:uncharacterized protein (TIGR04222 family)